MEGWVVTFVHPQGLVRRAFDLTDRVAAITGGAGLLGVEHAEAIAELGGTPVLIDINGDTAEECASRIQKKFRVPAIGLGADITRQKDVQELYKKVINMFGRLDILVNNAANNPKAETIETGHNWSRLETIPLDVWDRDIAVGLTGAFLCSRVFGVEMARKGKGVVLNIASDLALIAPDQRLYQMPGFPETEQPVKPVSYSVVKAGLVGLTRYLATYWAACGVRANALCPGGVFNGQDDTFVKRLSQLIPLGRMANRDEYRAAVAFMVSDASSYMNGAVVVMDGGRTAW
jgi:NAD(P)-dependent dehydrogenase (short-subunit alcohol dehydrogenase family)